jgi:DNA-binding GntR family transcriptional regulator
MHHIAIDDYVLDVLLPDLAGHDRSPAAFLIYVVLWTQLFRSEQRSVALSLQKFAELSGLSKSAVQGAIRLLKRRGLIRIVKNSATAVPQYELVRHWVKRRAALVRAEVERGHGGSIDR